MEGRPRARSKLRVLVPIVLLLFLVLGCNSPDSIFEKDVSESNDLNSKIIPIESTYVVNIYDVDANITHSWQCATFVPSRNFTFDKTTSSTNVAPSAGVTGGGDIAVGYTTVSSSQTTPGDVINMLIDGHVVNHVGSSVIAYDSGRGGLTDYRSEDSTTIPEGELKTHVIEIRTQNGKLMALFTGNDVELKDSQLNKATEVLVDGKPMLIYRCDYTIYESSMLNTRNGS